MTALDFARIVGIAVLVVGVTLIASYLLAQRHKRRQAEYWDRWYHEAHRDIFGKEPRP